MKPFFSISDSLATTEPLAAVFGDASIVGIEVALHVAGHQEIAQQGADRVGRGAQLGSRRRNADARSRRYEHQQLDLGRRERAVVHLLAHRSLERAPETDHGTRQLVPELVGIDGGKLLGGHTPTLPLAQS